MSPVSSVMLPLGTHAPDFSLPSVVDPGVTVSRTDAVGKPMLVMFLCNHCPFVKHVEDELAKLGQEFGDRVFMVGISANDVERYPDDGPEGLAQQAERARFSFPYLYDETQETAKAYDARCTPDFFLFDAHHTLVYRGRLDASTPRNDEPLTGDDLRAALTAVVNDEPVSDQQFYSVGCGIKWKE